jgi:hypothetical protein
MVEIPKFMKQINRVIVCPCGFDLYIDNIHELSSHISCTHPKGYCNNGMNFIEHKITCICGKSFDTFDQAEEHVKLKKRRCMNNYLTVYETTCQVCKISFENKNQLNRHEKSNRHIEKLNGTYKDIPLYCKICNIHCLSRNLMEQHLQTKKHKRLVESGECVGKKLDLDCKICNVKFTSQTQIRSHLNTKKHKDMIASGKIADEKISLTCDICKITCPSQKTIRAHLETKKHKKLLSIYDISQSVSAQ